MFGSSDFPKNDPLHCNCALTVKFEDKSCQDAFNIMKDKAEVWHPEPLAGGTYAIWDAIEEERIWATRTRADSEKTDDILFEFFGNPVDFRTEGCTVKAKSRSQKLSFYDHNINYCNMWNLLKEVEGKDSEGHYKVPNLEVTDCKFKPADPETTCATE